MSKNWFRTTLKRVTPARNDEINAMHQTKSRNIKRTDAKRKVPFSELAHGLIPLQILQANWLGTVNLTRLYMHFGTRGNLFPHLPPYCLQSTHLYSVGDNKALG